MRITAIEGVGEVKQSDIVNQRTVRGIRSFLDELDWADLVKLNNALEEHDCGVETEIEIECPACGGIQNTQLPFDRGFLLPPAEKSGRQS